MIMEQIVKDWLKFAFYDLFNSKDVSLIDACVREECINHRLAVWLEKHRPVKFFDYFVDIEYDKNNGLKKELLVKGVDQEVRPDIIVHKRSCNPSENLLVFECKKDECAERDKDKLDGFLCDERYSYKYGIAVVYRPKMNEDKFLLKINDSKYLSISYDLSNWDSAVAAL